ncbi:MAG: murein biosynthesis integral membrane protein MurJ [Candidatus Kerfeldbacteria bacterium]|nr:murein biosynthesis integral membrane protein MurJ [Candidatus Kerfeldbacteria bacterium]
MLETKDRTPLRAVTGGALAIAFFSVLSRSLGVLRDRLLASTFGAGNTLDAYYAAFKIPDFIFNIFVLGAVAAAFIPIYIRVRGTYGQAQAWHLGRTILNLITIVLAVCAALGALWAPELMPIIAPGFDASRQELAITLTRVMLVSLMFFGASNVVGSVLQAEQRFLSYSLAPVVYNLGIILGLYTFVPWLGPEGLAWGVVLGSLLHLLIQLPAVWRTGFRWRPQLDLKQKAVTEVLKLLGPRTIGLAASSLEQVIMAGFASTLAAGSVAAFTLAVNLQSFPISVFGVSLAVAVFPLFSQAFSANNHEDFISHFKDSVRRILFFVLPLSVLFLVLRAHLVRLVLGSGEFDWTATIRTAQVLGFLSLAMVADSLVPLLARAFYALRDTKTPALVAVATVFTNLVLLIITHPFGLAGIGLSYVVSRALNLALLVTLLGRRLKGLGADYILSGAARMLIASLMAGGAAYGTLQVLAPYVNLHTFIGVLTHGGAASLIGGGGYLILSFWWRLPEINFISRWLKSAWRVMLKLSGALLS